MLQAYFSMKANRKYLDLDFPWSPSHDLVQDSGLLPLQLREVGMGGVELGGTMLYKGMSGFVPFFRNKFPGLRLIFQGL